MVFNIEGLANLNRRAAEIFHTNALEPPSQCMQILGDRLKKNAQSKRKLPISVLALARTVPLEFDLEEEININPDSIIESISHFDDITMIDRIRNGDTKTNSHKDNLR